MIERRDMAVDIERSINLFFYIWTTWDCLDIALIFSFLYTIQ
jgi:hypothetical protein